MEDGALSAENMGRNRCTDILRYLHLVNNEGSRNRDRLWKLRPVVDKLQKQFLAGRSQPAVFSFDEGVLAATSKRNTTRMFMPDKPHRYGSKIVTRGPPIAIVSRCSLKSAKAAKAMTTSSARQAPPRLYSDPVEMRLMRSASTGSTRRSRWRLSC